MPILLDPAAPMERPGIGIVISSAEAYANPARGVAAFLGRARKGPLNTPMRFTNLASIERTFGGAPYGSSGGNTMDGAMQALKGGAVAVWIVRAGSGGVAATYGIAETGAATGVVITALGSGTDGNNLSVGLYGDPEKDPTRVLVVYENGLEVERFRYRPYTEAQEVNNLVQAVNELGSAYITAEKADTAVGLTFLLETAETPLAGGDNPEVLIADVARGLEALASAPFETVSTDSTVVEDVNLLVETVDQWILGGKLCQGVVAADPLMNWSGKMLAAQDINDPAITYVSNGFITREPFKGGDDRVEGYAAAGREAGRLTALALARQLTHSVVRDGVQSINEPPPDVIASASTSGCYLYSTNSRGQVWTEWGITSQKNFDAPPPWAVSTDSGWGKQRLVLTRFRLLTDIELAWSPLIETASNNNAGRESIRKEAQNVIDLQYVPTGAVDSGTVILHPDYPPAGERATYLVELVTPDGAEFLVLEAKFRR